MAEKGISAERCSILIQKIDRRDLGTLHPHDFDEIKEILRAHAAAIREAEEAEQAMTAQNYGLESRAVLGTIRRFLTILRGEQT